MSYSCVDFTDSILVALGILNVPEEARDAPDMQADLALAEIRRLQAIEKAHKASPGVSELVPTFLGS
jgi:hypothetical protein